MPAADTTTTAQHSRRDVRPNWHSSCEHGRPVWQRQQTLLQLEVLAGGITASQPHASTAVLHQPSLSEHSSKAVGSPRLSSTAWATGIVLLYRCRLRLLVISTVLQSAPAPQYWGFSPCGSVYSPQPAPYPSPVTPFPVTPPPYHL